MRKYVFHTLDLTCDDLFVLSALLSLEGRFTMNTQNGLTEAVSISKTGLASCLEANQRGSVSRWLHGPQHARTEVLIAVAA